MHLAFIDKIGDNVELTWKVDVGEHKGYVPLQFLKENRYSDDILIRESKQSRPDKTVAAKMVGCVSVCQLTCIK